MQVINEILGNTLTEAVGWFLIHSLWQGTFIALMLAVLLRFLRRGSAELRYYISFLALITLLVSGLLTFFKALEMERTREFTREVLTAGGLTWNSGTFVSLHSFGLKRITTFIIQSGIQEHFRMLVGIWFIGLFFYTIRAAGGMFRIFRLQRRGRIPVITDFQEKVKRLARQIHIRRKVRVFASRKVKTAITSGFLKPVILVPVSIITELPVNQVEAILLHELAHIKRNDYLLNIFQTLIETLFFYHPGVWFISMQIRKERENACDDIAVVHTGDRLVYAKALAEAQQHYLNTGQFAMSFSSGKNSLLERIKRLNTKMIMKTKLTEKLIAGTIILSAFIMLSFIIDGNNHFARDLKEHDADTAAAKKVYVIKSVIDSAGNESVSKNVYSLDDPNIDSILKAEKPDMETGSGKTKKVEVIISDDEDILTDEKYKTFEFTMDDLPDDAIWIEKAGDDEEVVHVKHPENADHVIIKKKAHTTGDGHEQVIVKVITDDKGITEERVIMSPEIEKEIQEAMEEARIEIEMANKEMEEAMRQIYIEAEIELSEKDKEKIELEVEKAMKEVQKAQQDMERANREVERANREIEYKYQYVISEEKKDEKMTLEEKEAALKEELEALEQELKEVKRLQKEAKKQN